MTSRFDITELEIPGLMIIQRHPSADGRGYFERIYCAEEFSAFGLDKPIAQINHSYSRLCGTVRGMHFQYPPYAETKVVSCLRGEVFDVAIDLRRDSPTFLRWHGEYLSAENQRSFLIPKGFAHGFQALQDDCELLYLHTASYNPAAEGAIHPGDQRVQVNWPLEISDISERDANHKRLDDNFLGLK